MADDFKKIIDNLEKSKQNLGEAKKKVNQWVDEIGFQEENTDNQGKLWKELQNSKINFPSSVMASGTSISQSVLENSNRVLQNIWDSGIEQSLYTAGTASEVLSGVSFSAVVYSPPMRANPPQSYIDLTNSLTQRNQQQTVIDKLEQIDPNIRIEYENAWSSLRGGIVDKTRGPMFLIREAIRNLYDHYAPDTEILKMFPEIKLKKDIQRQHKVKYIESLIDPWKRQTFLNEEKAFIDIYGELSKAHKDEQLNIEETKGILYQADGLIRLLLDSLT